MSTDPAYGELDVHTFRVAHGALLDFPLHPQLGSRPWAATMWPDHHHPGTWGRTMWTVGPGGRGWELDPCVHLGDVVEFGADSPAAVDRWYGYVTHADHYSLTLIGPFTNPPEAAADGQASLARWKDTYRRAALTNDGPSR